MNYILALTSPRRLEILTSNLGIPRDHIEVVGSTFEENLSKEGVDPGHYVTETARHKALNVVENTKHSGLLIASDTVVVSGGVIYEKPGTLERQLEMIASYKHHRNVEVLTAVHVVRLEKGAVQQWETALETTSLSFNTNLSDEFIQDYVDSREGLDVAGGFKYQALGATLFTGISGDYFNVVGLPVAKTLGLISRAGGTGAPWAGARRGRKILR